MVLRLYLDLQWNVVRDWLFKVDCAGMLKAELVMYTSIHGRDTN